MSYSNPISTRIQSGASQDMGNGTPTVFSFKGPKGMQGTIIDVGMRLRRLSRVIVQRRHFRSERLGMQMLIAN